MGLFSFFGKKKNPETENSGKSQSPPNPAIKISSTSDGKHGDHWGALFGFQYFFDGGGAEKFQQSLQGLVSNGVAVNGRLETAIVTSDFGRIFTRAVIQKESLVTIMPAIKTSRKIPVVFKEIIEWSHVGGLEAQVVASGRDKFALNFFADDYAENEQLYKNVGELDMHFAGIAYVMQPWSPEEIKLNGEVKLADDFVCYMPDSKQGQYSCIQYLGQAVAVEEVHVQELDHCDGYIVSTKLINDPEMEDFFVLDIFVHRDQLNGMEKPKPGDRVSGVCWLHGRIAGMMGISLDEFRKN